MRKCLKSRQRSIGKYRFKWFLIYKEVTLSVPLSKEHQFTSIVRRS